MKEGPIEKFLPRREPTDDPDILQLGETFLEDTHSARELIILMRNWVLMLEDLRSGKYAKAAEQQRQVASVPDPIKVLEHLKQTGQESLGLGLEVSLRGAAAAQQQSENSLTRLIEFAWKKFISLHPTPEDIALLKATIPELADKAATLEKKD